MNDKNIILGNNGDIFIKMQQTNINERAETPKFCEICGDICKAFYPLKLIFHDSTEIELLICLDCYNGDEPLNINVKRKHLVARITRRLTI